MRRFCLVVLLVFAGLGSPAHADRLRAAVELCVDHDINFDGLREGLIALGYGPGKDHDQWLIAEAEAISSVMFFFGTEFHKQTQIDLNYDMLKGTARVDFAHILGTIDGHAVMISRDPDDTTRHGYRCLFALRGVPEGLENAVFATTVDRNVKDMGFYKMTSTSAKSGGVKEWRFVADLDSEAVDARLPDRPGVSAVIVTNVKED